MIKGLGFFTTTIVTVILAVANAESPEPPSPKKDQDLKTREYMLTISRQLGVTCNHCHDVKNFKSAHMETFRVAEDHIHIVKLLNTQGFRGRKAPTADCFMCHRGKAVPDYKEVVSKKEAH